MIIYAIMELSPTAGKSARLLRFALAAGLMWFASACQRDETHAAKGVHSDITQLEVAIRMFENEYGSYPTDQSTHERVPCESIAPVLMAIPGDTSASEINPDNIKFLQAPEHQLKGGAFCDYWGNPYQVALDTDGDGDVLIGGRTIPVRVAVWSLGENEKDEAGRGDDIKSW